MLVCTAALMLLFYSCHELKPRMYHLLYVLCQCADFPQWSPVVLQTKIYASRNEFFHLKLQYKKKLKDTSDLKDCSFLSILFYFLFLFEL